jgi:hypothetical protein
VAISVITPIHQAVERTRKVLFAPFDLPKWLGLALCAFLADLGSGGNMWHGWGDHGGGGRSVGPGTGPWIESNLGLIVVGTLIALVVVAAIGALVLWLTCRGQFMFMDGIVRNRGDVVRPWHAYRRHANDLFVFTFLAHLGGLLGVAVFGAMGVLIAWPDLQSGHFGGSGLAGVAIGGLLVSLFVLTVIIVRVLLRDFVIPTMYLRDVRIMDAWSIVGAEILPGNAGVIILFYLMRIVLAIACAALVVLAVCFTCCIVGLPYIGTVILLPLVVFSRAYTLHFIEQFGPNWKLFTDDTPPAPPTGNCPRCHHPQGTPPSAYCPNCGEQLPPPPS